MDGMDAEFEQLITDIGPRLRTLRRDRGLTLEALSEPPASPSAHSHASNRGSVVPPSICCCHLPERTGSRWTNSSALPLRAIPGFTSPRADARTAVPSFR